MSPSRPIVTVIVLTAVFCADAHAQRATQRQPRLTPPANQPIVPNAPDVKAVEGKYYLIHSSLDEHRIREADLRMSKMAEEYHARTREFAGAIRSKFPFYLFKSEHDYLASGGMKGTAGCFNPNSNVLMAFDAGDAELWHVVQHEGFHQFASAVIGGELPIWVNEGLADYFGEAVFTGDSFVAGVIPEWRRQRVMKAMQNAGETSSFQSVEEMLYLDHARWNEQMALANYDQAWSMVHFLVHGDDGKYQKSFATFIRAISTGRPWERAWQESIGPADGFEARWKKYWLDLSENPTEDLYVQATTRAMTNFLARAQSQKQTFENFEAFAKSAVNGEIRTGERDWLPAGVLASAMNDAARLVKNGYQFSIALPAIGAAPGARLPQIVCTAPNGGEYIGKFVLRGGRVSQVTVTAPQSLDRSSTRNAVGRQKNR